MENLMKTLPACGPFSLAAKRAAGAGMQAFRQKLFINC